MEQYGDTGSSPEKQTVVLKDRKNLTLDGVRGIAEFADGALTLETVAGRLTAEGEDLRVESLDKESGRICVTGRFDAIYYAGEQPPERRGKGLFRKG